MNYLMQDKSNSSSQNTCNNTLRSYEKNFLQEFYMHMPIIIAEIKLKLPPTNQIKLRMLVRKGYKNKHQIIAGTAG